MQLKVYDNTSFGVNLNSPKLNYTKQDFYIKIQGYGRNPFWANKTIKTADSAVNLIRKGYSAENVLNFVAEGISKANKFCMELYKRNHSGLLRIPRDGWKYEDIFSNNLFTGYNNNIYKSYRQRLNHTLDEPLKNPYDNISLTRSKYNVLAHGKSEYINNALDYVFELSEKIFPKFIHQEVRAENIKEINETIAEIRWILAHSTPWTRGSDAISNVFIRAVYKAIGVKTYPLKKGVSLDLEAYCTQLPDYKNKFIHYFDRYPEIVD